MSQNRIQTLRKQRAWTQEQLAQCSGLSVRTIQRIENGEPAGAESLQALAAVFEVPVQALQDDPQTSSQPETTPTTSTFNPVPPEAAADLELKQRVQDEARFWQRMMRFTAVLLALLVLNLAISPSYLWVKWVALGWGLALFFRGLRVFQVYGGFGPVWQERRLQRLRAKT